MRIAVTSTVIFDVPEGSTLREMKERFLLANRVAIGQPMFTVTGQPHVMRDIERLEIERRDH